MGCPRSWSVSCDHYAVGCGCGCLAIGSDTVAAAGKRGTTYWSARSFELSLQCPDLAHPQRDLFCSQKNRDPKACSHRRRATRSSSKYVQAKQNHHTSLLLAR